jgi:RNA polymerase sigma-70 factor, ECF subfamily
MQNFNEQQLVSQCLCGCQSSWRELYARIENTVNYIVRWKRWGFSPVQMEEIAQEVLNNCISCLDTFDFNCSLETFVSTITKNKCVSELRRLSAAKRAGDRSTVPLQEYDCIPGSAETQERRLVHAEERRELAAALRQMDENYKTILRMRYYEERSYKQIAARLNIPAGTVASRLKRSLTHLKRKIEECRDEY